MNTKEIVIRLEYDSWDGEVGTKELTESVYEYLTELIADDSLVYTIE